MKRGIRWDNRLYGEYSIHHYAEAHLRMLRTPDWKLVRDFKNEGRDEFYHLAEDPNETQNLIHDSREDVAAMRDALDKALRGRMALLNDDALNGPQ